MHATTTQAEITSPRLAEGVELIGEFEGSGFKEPPLLARRADGQVVQLTRLLFLVAEACGGRDVEAVADAVSEQYGRRVSGDNVEFLVEEKLRPLGVLALADGSTPELEKRAPLLALRLRKAVLSEAAVARAAGAVAWLHQPSVQVPVLVAIAAFDVWLFFVHGLAGGMRSALYSPGLPLAVLVSVVVATAFHELGHASACRYGGARPGVMGFGVYLVWPAFYCDVTDAYRLSRAGRLRTDLGGVYFNALFALLAGGVYFVTGEEAALLAAFIQQVILLQQLLPLLRFDGYYVLGDLTGVPDILSRIKPIFRSLLRPRRHEPAVAELKPWVRAVVTIYLIVLVPELVLLVASMVMGAPRVLATTYDSLGLQLDRLQSAHAPADMALGGFQIVALIMPVAAMSLSLARTSRRAGRGVTRWASGSRSRSAVATAGVLAAVAAAGYVMLPNGDYQPIRPGERGTVGEAVMSIPDVVAGRPAFVPKRAANNTPAPTGRWQRIPSERLIPQTEESTRAKRKGEVRRRKPATSATPSGAASSGGGGGSTAAPTTASPIDTIRSTTDPASLPKPPTTITPTVTAIPTVAAVPSVEVTVQPPG